MHSRSMHGKRLPGARPEGQTFGASGSEEMGNPQSFIGIAPSPTLCENRCGFRLHHSLCYDSVVNDIAGEPFILTEYSQGDLHVFDKELVKKSLEITPVLEIGRTGIITSILAHSDMISFLPDFVAREQVEAGTLCYLDVADVNIDIWK